MELYEALAAYYDDIFPLRPEKVTFLNSLVAPHSDILDVACGTGSLAIALAKLEHDVIGIDLSEEMIDQAKRRAPGITWKTMDMLKIGKEFTQLDMISCLGNSLPHLGSEEDILSFLGQAHGILREGGKLVIQCMDFS